MIQKPDLSDRRILTFPVIHPCSEISQTTLLHSLISLANSICQYRSETFTTNKRHIRETIRQVEILLLFFQELQLNESVLPRSLFLSFFELHLAFQKIRFLLADCSREGAKLWILMKSKRVAAELQVLIRTFATALDVVPLGSLGLSTEMKELVQLVAKQAWKVKIEVDPDDARNVFDVLSTLNQFEHGVSPDPVDLKRVLDYLEIQNWGLCNKEIKFLDEEIVLRAEDKREEKEVIMLSSLMGFMCYCRCVVFDEVDGKQSQERVRGTENREVFEFLNLQEFRCPISLEIMKDPVTVPTGQTYDRVSIVKWFKAGNLSCPNTGKKLATTELVPNLILQKLIWQFCSNKGIQVAECGSRSRDITRTIYAGSPAAAEAMKLVSEFLARMLVTGSNVDRNKAAYEIRMLAKSSLFNRSCLLEAGTIPFLLNLLSSMDSSIQENSVAALLNLSKHSKSKAVIVENGGLILILDVLKEGLTLESRQLAAATMFYLSSVEEYRILIGEIPGAIPALVQLIRDGNTRGQKNAVVAIFGLLMFPGNHARVLESGTVPLLVDVLGCSERSDLVTDSLAILATLGEKPDGANAILYTSAAPLLVGILHSSTSRTAKEYCVSILQSLCINGGIEVVASLQKNSLLVTSLYSLLTDGTSRATKKANSILNILHGFQTPSSSGFDPPAVTQERIVHVR